MLIHKHATKIFLSFIVVLALIVLVPLFVKAQTTDDRVIDVSVTAPSFVQYVQFASDANFTNPVTLASAPVISWDICQWAASCPSGTYQLFVRYIDANGSIQYTTSRTVVYQAPAPVVYQAPAPVIVATPEPEPIPEPEPVIEPEIIEPEPEVVEVPMIAVVEPEEIKTPLRDWAQSQSGIIAATTIAGISIAGTLGTSVGSLFGSSFSLSQLLFLPLRIWNLLLIFFGIRRRSQPWGVVYDSKTKQPLDPVYVQLLNEKGEEVATSITDIQGRFGFLIEEPGNYHLNAGKTNYVFPSKEMASINTDVLYDEIYHGEALPLDRDGVITKNIPMDAQGEDWNQQEKNRMSIGGASKFITVLSHVIFYGGLIFTLVMTLLSPTKINLIFTFIYLGMQVLRMIGFHPRAFGVIKQTENNTPLTHAIIKIFSAALGHRVGHAVTDDKGRYYALVPKGEYYMTVEEKKEDGSYEELHRSQPFKVQKGIINTSIHI